MKELVLYSDKGETLRCNLSIEGANINNSEIRLLLECNNKNLLFKGKIDSSGACVINVPKLSEYDGLTGISQIEVINENYYFKLSEMPFKVKKSVSVKIEPMLLEESKQTPTVNFSFINESKEEEEEVKVEEIKENKQETLKEIRNSIDELPSFSEFLKSRRNT